MSYNVSVTYAPGGVNYQMPDTLRNPQQAADGQNFVVSDAMHLTKRPGWAQKSATDAPGFGLAVFEQQNIAETLLSGYGNLAYGQDPYGSPSSLLYGSSEDKLVGLGPTPKIWTQGEVTLTYTAGGTATLQVSNTTSGSIVLALTDSANSDTDVDLSTGNEGSPVTITSLVSSVNALAGFSCTLASGDGATPAAFIDWVATTTLTSGIGVNLHFGYWAEMSNTVSEAPLSEITNQKSSDNFENPVAVAVGGNLYISNGFNDIHKYDGQTLYKAGLPQGNAPTASVNTGVAAPGGMSGVYSYRTTFKYLDASNSTLEGHISDASASADNSAGPYGIDVTLTNMVEGAGYNTKGAIVSGTHASTNVGTNQERIDVDSGHTLVAGDRAYLYDNNVPGYATYKVLSVDTTTVTLQSSSTISVNNNDPISANMRIVIWRTEAGGSTYYVVDEVPNNPFNSTQVYSDTTADADLGATYGDGPAKTPGSPPRGRYMTVWRNQLIVAGDPDSPENLYYSEYDGTSILPENFPGVNVFQIAPGSQSGAITGLYTLGRNLFVFTEDQTFVVEGNLANDDVRIDRLANNVGCVAHHTIKNADDKLLFLSKKGVYAVVPKQAGYTVELVSGDINPILTIDANNNFRRSFKRASAEFWQDKNWYVMFLPEEETSGSRYAKPTSEVYVNDLDTGAWYRWTNVNAQGGMAVFDDGESGEVMWFMSREDTSDTSRTCRFNQTKTEIDYSDHTSAVDCSYRAQWEFGKDPNTPKNFFEISLDSLRGVSQLAYTPSGDITISLYEDFDPASELLNFDVTYESNDEQIVEALPSWEMRSLGVKFSNSTINKQILITGWGLEFTTRGRRIRGQI